MAAKRSDAGKPRNWAKAVEAAYLRLVMPTQKEAAKAAGLGVRTLRRYELSDWWPRACAESVDRWTQQLEIECRTAVMALVKRGDGVTVVKMLERLDKRLAPPRQSHGIEHSGGIATSVREMSDEELLERARQFANRITAQTNGGRCLPAPTPY